MLYSLRSILKLEQVDDSLMSSLGIRESWVFPYWDKHFLQSLYTQRFKNVFVLYTDWLIHDHYPNISQKKDHSLYLSWVFGVIVDKL